MSVWGPVVERRADLVSVRDARALHDLLDRDEPRPVAGDRLPILWHWLAFLPSCSQAQLGADGHPRTGAFLPPAEGRQRMYAGGKVTSDGPLWIGEPLTRTSEVTDVTEKQGRSGSLTFVTVNHAIAGERGALCDRSDIVYKAPRPFTAQPRPGQDVSEWHWERIVEVDSRLLFRFSALTYNAHRIHYDREYATNVEGYPGLVVHGPLQAILLADAVRRICPGRAVASFDFRSTAPAFDTHPLQLRARVADGDAVELAAFSDRRRTMTATAVLEPSGAA